MTKKKRIILLVCAVVLAILIPWTVWSNITLDVTEYTIQSRSIPDSFDGFRIAQVSDLHNDAMGKPGGKLLAALRSAQPDIIAITGDLIDSRSTDVAAALEFMAEAQEIAPCYYVSGNHESRSEEDYALLKAGLLTLGVVVLENEATTLRRQADTITLAGVTDPAFDAQWPVSEREAMTQNLSAVAPAEGFSILLSHRPELLDMYAEHGWDLILSGHAHGGQLRLPWVGALYIPHQGFFPEYDAGLFEMGDTRMIISRGIGDSLIPLRFHNPSELVLVTLNPQ